MKLVSTVATGLGLTSADHFAIVQEAERLGYTAAGPPRPTTRTPRRSSALAGKTSRSARRRYLPYPARGAAMTATEPRRPSNQLSDGACSSGSARRAPQVFRGWHGQWRFGNSLQRTREYIEVLRSACPQRRVLTARRSSCRLPDWPCKAPEADEIAPVQELMPDLPTSPRESGQEQPPCGEVADGWMPTPGCRPSTTPDACGRNSRRRRRALPARRSTGSTRADRQPHIHRDDVGRGAGRDAAVQCADIGGMGLARQDFYNRSGKRTPSRTPPASPRPISRPPEGVRPPRRCRPS